MNFCRIMKKYALFCWTMENSRATINANREQGGGRFMFKITEKSHGQRLLSLVLAVILLFSFMQFNVQPAAADTAGVDVAVVALRVSGNTVTTTLRLVQVRRF